MSRDPYSLACTPGGPGRPAADHLIGFGRFCVGCRISKEQRGRAAGAYGIVRVPGVGGNRGR